MKSFWQEQNLEELYKAYPGEGWLDPGKRPKFNSLKKKIAIKNWVATGNYERQSNISPVLFPDSVANEIVPGGNEDTQEDYEDQMNKGDSNHVLVHLHLHKTAPSIYQMMGEILVIASPFIWTTE